LFLSIHDTVLSLSLQPIADGRSKFYNLSLWIPTIIMASAAASPTLEQSSKEEPKAPYSIWFHPYLTWKDLIISFLFSLTLPFYKIAKHSPNSDEGRKVNEQLRERMNKLVDSGFSNSCRRWSKTAGGLAQSTWKVPRRPTILQEWGIMDRLDALMKQVAASSSNNNEFIDVLVWCPWSLILKDGQEREENECGCVEVP
jgi:hypothetical protein